MESKAKKKFLKELTWFFFSIKIQWVFWKIKYNRTWKEYSFLSWIKIADQYFKPQMKNNVQTADFNSEEGKHINFSTMLDFIIRLMISLVIRIQDKDKFYYIFISV